MGYLPAEIDSVSGTAQERLAGQEDEPKARPGTTVDAQIKVIVEKHPDGYAAHPQAHERA